MILYIPAPYIVEARARARGSGIFFSFGEGEQGGGVVWGR